MSDRVNYNNGQSVLLPRPEMTDPGATVLDPNDPNLAATIEADVAGQWDGSVKPNKYVARLQRTAQGEAETETHSDLEAIMQGAGAPPMSAAQLTQIENSVAQSPQAQAGVTRMQDDISHLAGPDREARGADLINTAHSTADVTGMDVWQLLIVALKGSLRDQNEQQTADLVQLQMLSRMSEQMGEYTTILQKAQSDLDNKMHEEKDDKKKANVEVAMPDQRSYDSWNMATLDVEGKMSYNNTADPAKNMVSAQGLNIKLQGFTQQRDQLQKKIDQRTQRVQTDNENKNQVASAITAILKNFYDMLNATTRNINM